jgi:hypothetical protein
LARKKISAHFRRIAPRERSSGIAASPGFTAFIRGFYEDGRGAMHHERNERMELIVFKVVVAARN